MKKRNDITAKICLFMFLLAFLAMIALPFQAWATEDDFDNDGILNSEEGALLPDYFTYENIPDLFIRLLSAELTEFPVDPFEFITMKYDIVPINVHVITSASDQKISSTQYAVNLIEDQRTTDGVLGYSNVGVPTQKLSGRVYPNRIKEDVINACNKQIPENCECINSAGAIVAQGIDDIVTFYQKNVLAHEVFHMLDRVRPLDKKLDYHYAQIGKIMDHHMTYKVSKKDKKVTWYITDEWTNADIPIFK